MLDLLCVNKRVEGRKCWTSRPGKALCLTVASQQAADRLECPSSVALHAVLGPEYCLTVVAEIGI